MERERVKDACWLLSIEWVKERPPAFWVLSFLNTWHLHFGWLLVGYSYRRGLYNTVKTSREYSSQKTSFLCLFGIWGRHWSTSKLLILSIHNHIKKKKQRYVLGFFGWYLVVWFSFWLDMTLIVRTIWFQWLHTNLCLHRYSRTEMEGHPDPTSAATAMIPEASIRRINPLLWLLCIRQLKAQPVNELEKPIPITHQSQLLNNPYLGLPLQVGDAIEECEGMLVSRNLFCAILWWK